MRLLSRVPRLSAVRCGAATRIGSAHDTQLLRPLTCLEGGSRYFTSTIQKQQTQSPAPVPPLTQTAHTRTPRARPRERVGVRTARAQFATMHRAPAAMVTKPLTDPNVEIRTPRDPNTLSNYHNFLTKHTAVDFEIDFKHKILSGAVALDLESLTDEDVKEIVLDSR